jgi:uridine phosphorylase
VILTYQPFLLDELRERGMRPTAGYPGPWRSLWFTGGGARTIAVVGGFGIGAPAATTVLEELIALGVREFISIGAAGCLQPRCGFGEAVVCTGAIRDEGVSHHYAPAEKFAWPSETLTRRLAQALAAGGTAPHSGLAWTIDAPYRETVAEARSYQAEGVVCVEMEAAALFTVGRYRGVDVAAAFVISDHLLAEDRWTHAFGTPALRQASIRLLDAALHASAGKSPPPGNRRFAARASSSLKRRIRRNARVCRRAERVGWWRGNGHYAAHGRHSGPRPGQPGGH